MKKLLIITRDFPPYAGSGNIMRIFKFAKYLPKFDWQPFVISEKLRRKFINHYHNHFEILDEYLYLK